MNRYLFFDNASTTRCCPEAIELICRFASEDFGNPSSSHLYGQHAAKAIADARAFFSKTFGVTPPQIIFTGSGSESDNLAIYGVAMNEMVKTPFKSGVTRPRILCSAIEHPAVRKTVQSLSAFGFDVQLIPVDANAQISKEAFLKLLTPETVLVSVQQVNNIVGSVLPVEDLARIAKEKVPGVVFHTDAVQAFGKVDSPRAGSLVDLVSVSSHKIEGPKGVGALIVLNSALMKDGIRPMIWGGEQEGGFRSGTQSAGLIAGFHVASMKALVEQKRHLAHVENLRSRLKTALHLHGIKLTWNSPENAVPHIVNLSATGYPAPLLAQLLEERFCLVSTGSACSSKKVEPDAVLSAMGLSASVSSSAIRVSFSSTNTFEEIDQFAEALDDSMKQLSALLGSAS